MKKLFDKYVAQSSKGQIITLALAFVVLVVVGGFVGKTVASADKGDNIYDFGRPETWGFMQCVDGGFVQATIRNNTVKTDDDKVKEPAPVSVILLSLGFWLSGMILVAFFTGAATDFLSSRREKILVGDVDYRFKKKYILIVGFDFQVKNLVHRLLAEHRDCDIALVTDKEVEDIYDDMMPELEDAEDLDKMDAHRVFVMRKDIVAAKTYSRFTVSGAKEIYLVGDGDVTGRDGKTLQALERLAEKVCKKPQKKGARPVKVYMHIEDLVLYTQVRAMKLPADTTYFEKDISVFDLEVYNYYESWAWECWAHKDAQDPVDGSEAKPLPYLPLRHISGSRHVALFVIGAGRMGRAMVNFAMPLMNYGEDGKHCKITIFDPNGLKKSFLPDAETLGNLPEIEVEFREMDGCSDAANDIMLAAAKMPETSVTVVIALSDPGAAVRAYSELSNRLRRENVSVLVWQATHSSNCPCKKYLMMGGPGSEAEPNPADKTTIRYFGMTDKLPWKDTSRFNAGMAVSYFYECWFHSPKYGGKTFDGSWSQDEKDAIEFDECGDAKLSEDQAKRLTKLITGESPLFKDPKFPKPPETNDEAFLAKAHAMWQTDENGDGGRSKSNGIVAGIHWGGTLRWGKWSSVNSGDTFREKAGVFKERPYAEAVDIVLKAEHNRWWTERLLAGWTYEPSLDGTGSHADKQRMLHGDMKPFEQLTEDVKDKDKINIAAMAACGFV